MFVAIFFITKHCLRRKKANNDSSGKEDGEGSGSPKELEAGLAGLTGAVPGLGGIGGLLSGLQPPQPAVTSAG